MKKPNRKDVYTDSGLHSLMQAWARTHDKPRLELIVTFEGEEPFVLHTFERWTKKVKYLAHDGKYYTVEVDMESYDPDFLEIYALSRDRKIGVPKTALRKLISNWLSDCPIKSTFKLVAEK